MKTYIPHRRIWLPLTALAVLLMTITGCGGEEPEQTTFWTYDIENEDGRAVLDTEAFNLVFEGMQIENPQAGQFQIAGPGASTGAIPLGPDLVFQHQYAEGTLTMTLGERTIRISDAGSLLAVQGNTYTLTNDPTLVLQPDGTIDYRAD